MKIGALVVGVLLGAIGFLPLFGGPGYEQAIATGLVAPSAAAISTALYVARGRAASPLAAVGRGVLTGLAFAGVALLTALLHAARVGLCELWGALFYFLLTATIGTVLGGVWGAVAGEVVHALAARKRIRRAPLLAVVVALAGPIAGVVVSTYRFYTSPMVFAFDPFVGYFSGVLYDTVIDAGPTLLTYRLGTLATLIAAALVASVLEHAPERSLGLVLDIRETKARARAALGLLAAAASAGMMLSGVALGYYSTAETIAKDLGGEKHGARCDVVFPSTTREQEAKLLVKDCDEEIVAVEKALGTRGPDHVRAFFFRDENDKKRLMGAAHTYIAKPWRKEVYLQMGAYPHPVLGHELAHVVAGSFGRGPFEIAGAAGGYIMNPGLIEGVAVAASPEDEDLTDAQWARAMLQIGILPPMQRVFSFGFLGDTSAKSYTLAGAFITWMGGRWGMDHVREWYSGGDVVTITGLSWPALDLAFRDYLSTVPLPDEAASFARARFFRPGIFGRKCPHVVDALRHEADICRDTQRWEEAIRLYNEALAKDPQDFSSRNSKAVIERRHLDRERGRAELEDLAKNESVPRTWRDRAEEALADADFVAAINDPNADLSSARARYQRLAALSLDEDSARTLEVKTVATEDLAARGAISGLLIGDEKHAPDLFVAGVALGRWGKSPLASYLIGRNFITHGFFEKGAATLDEALDGPLPTERITRETLRLRAVAACALADDATLASLRTAIEKGPFETAGGRRDATLRMIDRCRQP